jgi:PAS domain S-box-containing protein
MFDINKSTDSLTGFKKRLVTTAILLNVLVYTLSGMSLYQSRLQHENKAAISTQNIAKILESNVKGEINTIDTALLAVKHEAERQIALGGIDRDAINSYMARQHSYLPQLQGIRMTNSRGGVMYGTGGLLPGVIINMADRDYFIYERDNPKGNIFISKPVLGRIAKQWVFNIARRVNNPDGTFAGTLYAALTLDHFVKLFSSIDTGKSGAVALRDAELSLIVRYPEIKNSIGSKSVSTEFSESFNSGNKNATFKGRVPIDNAVRLVSFQKISNYPLVIVVALAEDEYFAGWRKEVLTQLTLIVFFTLITIISSRFLLTSWRQEKKVEDELSESEKKFRSLAESSQDYIMRYDRQCRHTYMNPAGLKVSGMTESDVFGKTHRESGYPEELSLFWEEQIRNVFDTAEPCIVEFEWESADGTVYIDWRLTPELDKNSVVKSVLGVSRDITERKRAEEALERSRNELELRVQERTAELNIILENAPIGISKIIDRKQVWVNRKAEELFKYSKEEMEFQTIRKLYTSDEAYEKHGQEAYPALAQGMVYETVQELIRKDGVHVLIRYVGKAVEPADMSKGTIWLLEDVTERKHAEEELIEAKAVAESANRLKSEFLANMSHEIRTPMNGVIGMAQLLEMTDLTDEQREYVSALKLSGNNLMTLINNILDLSKIEAGKITVEMAEFSLQQCINDIVLMQKAAIHGKGLELVVDIAADINRPLLGDQLRVKQILLNLLGNATKFTAQGGVTISARLLEQHETSVLVQIEVRDTGIGISAEALPTIFAPFSQEDGTISRKYGGTGLGLTITQRLAELLGGGITVESTPGIGSCFTVTLPFFTVKDAAVIQETPKRTMTDWDGPPLRILFVEDDQVNISLGRSLLKKLGHEVTVAENGRECLSVLEQAPFDLVLMDIQMPVMDGEEAIREIRTKEKKTFLHQPVVALTAYSLRGERARFLAAGFDGYVSKPLAVTELVGEMKRVLGRAVIAPHDTVKESHE